MQSLLPYVAQGMTPTEAGIHAHIHYTKAKKAWEAFQAACGAVTGEPVKPSRSCQEPPSEDEYAIIRDLAAKGLSCAQIAEQIQRSKSFVKEHFYRATGYRRGSHRQNTPITPEKVEKMKTLAALGVPQTQIAKAVGCSNDSVWKYLHVTQ